MESMLFMIRYFTQSHVLQKEKKTSRFSFVIYAKGRLTRRYLFTSKHIEKYPFSSHFKIVTFQRIEQYKVKSLDSSSDVFNWDLNQSLSLI